MPVHEVPQGLGERHDVLPLSQHLTVVPGGDPLLAVACLGVIFVPLMAAFRGPQPSCGISLAASFAW